jgi:hypothetical protein
MRGVFGAGGVRIYFELSGAVAFLFCAADSWGNIATISSAMSNFTVCRFMVFLFLIYL